MAKTCILKLLECFLKYQHVVDLKEGEPTSWLVFYIYKLIQVYSISSVSEEATKLPLDPSEWISVCFNYQQVEVFLVYLRKIM